MSGQPTPARKESHYNTLMRTPKRLQNTAYAWLQRHMSAIMSPKPFTLEQALVLMFKGWLMYADAHLADYESPIGDDMILGPEWASIGKGLRNLLNGELGRMDAGTLDSVVVDALCVENLYDE